MLHYFQNLVDPYVRYAETDHPPTRISAFLQQFVGPFRGAFAITGILSIAVAAIEIWLVAYLGRIVDLLDDGPANFWADHGVELAAIAAFLLFLRPLVQTAQVALLNNAILPNFVALVRWRSHRHVLRQSAGWFEDDFAGRISNRVMQMPSSAGEVVYQLFDAITFAIAYLVGAFILLAGADLRLIVPMLVWLVPYLFLLRWVVRRLRVASHDSSEARSQLTGRIVDSYTNVHSVKMFAHHDRELAYAREGIEQTRTTFQREMGLYTLMEFGLIVLNGVLVVGVVGWALWLWSADAATVGIVAAATAMTLRLNGMSGWIMWAVSHFFQELGVVAEGMETVAQPVTLVDRPGATPLQVSQGEIRIEGLRHHYGKDAGGLDGIDLVVQPGEKVGLVGPSGAGKSTLIKLVLRLYDAEQGLIAVDGQDIAAVTQDSLRSAIGMVSQDSSLLHRSVRDNILYGDPKASEEAMVTAARQAAAHDFILGLVDRDGNTGYDAKVGERGVKLSGGQRQRIALARVMLKNAPILLLDEATSALDSEVEAAIQDTLDRMMDGKTVIAIAHRLSTIARMDRIVVMDDGRIIEDGTHASLLAEDGLYARLWHRQSGGFIGTEAAA